MNFFQFNTSLAENNHHHHNKKKKKKKKELGKEKCN